MSNSPFIERKIEQHELPLREGTRALLPYDFETLQAKWRPYWQAINLYNTGDDPEKPDIYILDFFPYPSGDGLSVGHCRNYVPTCVASRFHRMRGYNVLHPMGWDSFGLPAENYAILHSIHPRISSQRHAATYKRQMQLVECSYDWSREFSSTDPDYYRWTQWFFLLLFKRGLAYQAVGSQWWCPVDKTILANEQVENGRCWRCGSLVTKKDLNQWYFKITAYAERLLADLDLVDWPEHIKLMQRNWIGRSEGAEITFDVVTSNQYSTNRIPTTEYRIPVFTTRPDTLFGVTFLALAPEHRLVQAVTTPEHASTVAEYVETARRASEIDRASTTKEKSGVFTGAYARHPATGEAIPIWVADYVLPTYGSGAIMGVPAHDERDAAFAERYALSIIPVIENDTMINSGKYSGMQTAEGASVLVQDLSAEGKASYKVSYKFRDWLISRQRYWGAPIPIVHCADCGAVTVPEDQLPVLLPVIDDFAPSDDGRSPLAKVESWVNTTCPHCGGPAQRETDTMDGFACSSWYFLRFASPHEDDRPFDPDAVRRWLPVDIYVGGAEHAVMHLLYARFWTKVMYDAGLIDFVEPFTQLQNQGVLHAADGRRMSKSRGNVVTPDEVIAQHGTDALRAYILFIGPFEGDVTWDSSGITGINRFLERFWRLAHEPLPPTNATSSVGAPLVGAQVNADFERQRHETIKRVTADFEAFKFNTAIAALMEYLNYLLGRPAATPDQWREAITTFTLLLAPIAPFITEEIWQNLLGHEGESVHQQPWPEWDEAVLAEAEIEIAVLVDGRVRDRIRVSPSASEETLRAAALASEKVQRHINGRTIAKSIVVPGQLINLVTQ